MEYFKNKRGKVDRCNICLEIKDLTWDHIPPKGGITLTAIEIFQVMKLMSSNHDQRRVISQNGLKFRFLCGKCNSKLGSDYDLVLNEFTKDLSRYLNSGLVLPSVIKIKTKPLRLIKSILGHILSCKRDIDETVIDRNLRKYVFDDNANLPNDVNIFYWVYPYQSTVLLRDFAMPAQRGDLSKHGFFQMIKYFPIAFLVSDLSEYEGLDCLQAKDLKLDDQIEIPIRLSNIKDNDWPERVDETNLLFGSKETSNGVFALPKLG